MKVKRIKREVNIFSTVKREEGVSRDMRVGLTVETLHSPCPYKCEALFIFPREERQLQAS